ncbi:MAG TPA: secretin N-terminal domain-containing protein [Verrucomicrobiae bacterium]|jgi:general secretion pathway protein D|nr:secretin N-terminal domain-containing protein [Verrucomicrobiae bacterium]
MNLKSLMPLFLLSALAMAVGERADSLPADGWQVAQVQIPQRRITTNGTATPVPSAATPVTPASTPSRRTGGPNIPYTPRVPSPAPTAAPLAPRPATPPGLTASTNSAPEKADIMYTFPAIPVEQLLDIYADLVGRTLLRSSAGPAAITPTQTVTLKTESPLTKSEAIIALETILGMNGITIVPLGDKFAKVVTEAVAGHEGGIISTNATVPEAGKFVTQIVQVKYASLDDLSKVLQPFSRMPDSIIALPSTQTLILRDYAENVNRMMEMIKRIDVTSPLIIKPKIIPIRYALASDIATALSALGASGGTSVGKSSSGANFGSRSGNGTSGFGGTSGNGFGGTSGAGGYPGQPTTMGQTSGIGSAATSARSSFQNNLQKIVNNAASAGQFQLFGQTKIIADERTNSLLVFANDEDMKMIQDIISKLDVVLAQVLIDAIVMEINLTGTESTGVSYLVQRQNAGTFAGAGGLNNLSSAASGFLTGSTTTTNGTTGATSTASGSTLANLPGGFSYFAKFGNDLNVVLEAVAGDSRVNVLSRPRIQTSHAVPADLFIGNTVPYVTGTYNYGYGAGPSSQYTQLEVGIHLQVLPLINPDGLVVMDIQADVEQLGPGVQIAGVGSVPTTTKREAGAKVAVRDGETIILGGFISDSRTVSDSGIPYLKDIPVLGNLFKSRSTQDLRTELIMLMRPTVLPTPAAAALVATRERNKLSGVKQAEYEIRQEEEKRNAQIEEELANEAAKRAKEAAKHKGHDQNIYTNGPSINSIPPVEE